MSEKYIPAVVGAAVLGDHVLRLLFSDGTVGDVDFSAEHWIGVLEPLNDPTTSPRSRSILRRAPWCGRMASIWPRNRSTSRHAPTHWCTPDGTIVLLTVFRKTRQHDQRQIDRAVRAQKLCESDHHGRPAGIYERQV